MKNIYTLLIALALIVTVAQTASSQTTPTAASAISGGSVILQGQVAPNPATDVIKVTWFQNLDANVRIQLINVDGSVATTFTNQFYHKGNHLEAYDVIKFERKLYFLRIQVPGKTWTTKLLLQ